MKKYIIGVSLIGSMVAANFMFINMQASNSPPRYDSVKSITYVVTRVGHLNEYMIDQENAIESDLVPLKSFSQDNETLNGVVLAASLKEIKDKSANFRSKNANGDYINRLDAYRSGVLLYDPEEWDDTPVSEYYDETNQKNTLALSIDEGYRLANDKKLKFGIVPSIAFTYKGSKCNGVMDPNLKAPGKKDKGVVKDIDWKKVSYFVFQMQGFMEYGCGTPENRMKIATKFYKDWSFFLKEKNPDIKVIAEFAFQRNSKDTIYTFINKTHTFSDGYYLGLSCTNLLDGQKNLIDPAGGCQNIDPNLKSYTAEDVLKVVSFIRDDKKVITRTCTADNNEECRKSVKCPLNRKISKIKAACDLTRRMFTKNPDGVEGKWKFNPDDLIANRIEVLNQTDDRSECFVDNKEINVGTTSLAHLIGTTKRFDIGCENRDLQGTGKCKISLELTCSL